MVTLNGVFVVVVVVCIFCLRGYVGLIKKEIKEGYESCVSHRVSSER